MQPNEQHNVTQTTEAATIPMCSNCGSVAASTAFTFLARLVGLCWVCRRLAHSVEHEMEALRKKKYFDEFQQDDLN